MTITTTMTMTIEILCDTVRRHKSLHHYRSPPDSIAAWTRYITDRRRRYRRAPRRQLTRRSNFIATQCRVVTCLPSPRDSPIPRSPFSKIKDVRRKMINQFLHISVALQSRMSLSRMFPSLPLFLPRAECETTWNMCQRRCNDE